MTMAVNVVESQLNKLLAANPPEGDIPKFVLPPLPKHYHGNTCRSMQMRRK